MQSVNKYPFIDNFFIVSFKENFHPMNSGFVRTNKIISKPQEHTTISTGIPSLDGIVELSHGSVTAIYEDEYTFAHNYFLQTFVSETIYKNPSSLLALSKEKKNMIYFNHAPSYNESAGNYSEDAKLLIAWKYKELNFKELKFQWNLLDKKEIPNEYAVADIEDLINKMKVKKACRIVIFSIFSPLYFSSQKKPVNSITDDNMKIEYIQRCLFEIRKYAKINDHIVYMSFPAFFFNSNFSLFFDNIFQLESLMAMQVEKFYYNCLIEFKKISKTGSLLVNELESSKFGIKMKSKKIQVERIDIPPEENDNSVGCGSF